MARVSFPRSFVGKPPQDDGTAEARLITRNRISVRHSRTPTMPTPLYTVDAFTDRPFSGNPAAVCLLDARPRDDAWMQSVAREMNLSETAFVRPRAGADGFDLRWFTPAVEVDLCGHATLAAAHVLWETWTLPPQTPARFHTRSGVLTASRAGGG